MMAWSICRWSQNNLQARTQYKMRHQKKTLKLGRKAQHRNALLSNQVCSLIEHHRIKTTLAKAKAVRPMAERMVTLGKKGDLHARRTAISYLHHPKIVKLLFDKIAPAASDRKGGYTRIIKIGSRNSDAAPMAYLEWVDLTTVETDADAEETPETKPAAKKSAAKKSAAAKTAPKATGKKASDSKAAVESPEAEAEVVEPETPVEEKKTSEEK